MEQEGSKPSYDLITEMGLFSLRLVRRLRKDAENGNEYADRVLREEDSAY